MKHRLKFTLVMLMMALALFVTNAQAQSQTDATDNQNTVAAGDAATQADAATPPVVTRLNNLTGNVTLAAGTNTKITRTGNTLTIASTASTPAVPPIIPFQRQSTVKFVDGEIGAQTTIKVPAGKRLVIETVAVFGQLFDPDSLDFFTLDTTVNGITVGYSLFLNVFPTTDFPTIKTFGTNQPLRLYADPGTLIVARAVRSRGSAIQGQFIIAVSGYLVDAK